MGTVHFLRQTDRNHVSREALSKHQAMIDEIRDIHQKVKVLLETSNALMDEDLKAIGTDPNYRFDNGVRKRLNELRAEREALTERAQFLISTAREYLNWYEEVFKK